MLGGATATSSSRRRESRLLIGPPSFPVRALLLSSAKSATFDLSSGLRPSALLPHTDLKLINRNSTTTGRLNSLALASSLWQNHLVSTPSSTPLGSAMGVSLPPSTKEHAQATALPHAFLYAGKVALGCMLPIVVPTPVSTTLQPFFRICDWSPPEL